MRPGVRLVLELTDGCNLDCVHCFRTLSDEARFMDLALIESLLDQANDLCGPVLVSLTGGEPTIHPRFADILDAAQRRGHRFSFVTNGWTFRRVLDVVQQNRSHLDAVTVSMDGAEPASHDEVRGEGSFERALNALTLCQAHALPTQVNMVVTRHNRGELDAMVQIATRLGCRALGFAHCMPTPASLEAGLVLDVNERRALEADISTLQETYRLPILLAGDHFDPFPLAGCEQLELREFNVTAEGMLTACCQLSGFRGARGESSQVADLTKESLKQALVRLTAVVGEVRQSKAHRLSRDEFEPEDFFICTHCYRFHGIDNGPSGS